MSYSDFMLRHQDEYYAIRDFIRECLIESSGREAVESIFVYLLLRYGSGFAHYTEELIADVVDLLAYEAANGLPEEC